jgi:signal transduction histidine kinase
MNRQEKIPGIALRCDREGIIREILKNTLGGPTVFQPGKNILQIIHEGSIPKGINFFTEIRAKGKAIDWELFMPIRNRLDCIHFSGSLSGEDLFLIGAKDRHDLDILTAEWKSLGFLDPLHGRSQESCEVDEDTFDRFTVLYNEMSNLQRQVAKKNAELEKISKKKDYFVGMAAHEFRHPLGIIQMLSDFLLDETASKLKPEHIEYINQIKTNSLSMQKLVDDMLDITLIERGKFQIKKTPANLVEVFQKSIALTRLAAQKKQIEIDFFYDDKIPQVMVDPPKIEQVLNNLISNALKFSPVGSQVQVHLRHSEDRIIFEIIDQGYGIPENVMPQMFEAFEKFPHPHEADLPGAGLGLAIARKIVEAHEGRIQAESKAGGGSTFTVTLPIK